MQKKRTFLLDITQNPADPRATLVKTTLALKAYLNKIETKHSAMLNALFQDYTDKEIKTFFDLAQKMFKGIKNIEKNSTTGENSV